MISEVIMPKLGQTMEEGRVVEWFKAEGDEIRRGDILYTLESDKAALDVEATGRGWLRRILVAEDEVVPVLTVVALITTEPDEPIDDWRPVVPAAADGSDRPAALQGSDTPTAPQTTVSPEAPGASTPAAGEPVEVSEEPARSPERLAASPRARRLAAERGVDLKTVAGTGPDGRIVEADVLAAATAASGPTPNAVTERTDPAAPGDAFPRAELSVARTVPLTGRRGLTAERMTQSARTIPQVALTTEVDADNLQEARGRLSEVEAEWGFAPGYAELIGYLTMLTLREHPELNARLSANGQAIEILADINLGLAVDTGQGLLVPVVTGADGMDLRTFATRARELITRARDGNALPDDLTGGTFTITSLGALGVDAFTPLINPPEAAILGLGRIREKPAVFAGRITPRPLLTLSLVFDHRIVDGAPAARFLQRLGEMIEHPEAAIADSRGDGRATSAGEPAS